MTQIGELRDQISIIRKTQTSDGMGGWTITEKTILSPWAMVEAPKSKTGIIAQKDTEIRTHQITIRYYDGVQIGDIVSFFGTRLVVKAIRHDQFRRWMYLDCEPEVV
jgi:SPP1 family predicted phage head-tail adaptor